MVILCEMGEQVIGHYVPAEGGEGWQAALAQSTELFRSLVADDLAAFERHLAALDPSEHSSSSSSSWHTVLFWSAANPEQQNEAKVEAKSRTLAMLATQHGSLRVLSYLLSKGSCPTEKAPKDGADCYAVSADSWRAGWMGIIMGTRALHLLTKQQIVWLSHISR
jgi:hypothetical protein